MAEPTVRKLLHIPVALYGKLERRAERTKTDMSKLIIEYIAKGLRKGA